MKNFLAFIFLISIFSSCSNELDVSAEYKEVPVIYGLLNQNQSQHYVQVFKGFLDEETNSLTLAKNPDSIFYDDANVDLKIEHNGQTVNFQRVDLSLDGSPREPGIFLSSPNFAYVFSENLNSNEVYNLTFTNKKTGHTATASTTLIKDFEVTRPLPGAQLNFHTANNISVIWKAAENGKLYELAVRFYFEEWNVNSPAVIDTKFVDWKIFDNITLNNIQCCSTGNTSCCGNLDHTIDGRLFFSFLKVNLNSDPNIRRKSLDEPFEFRFYVGADELYKYIQSGDPQGSISSLSIQSPYTNIQNGLGIFSSRYTKIVSGLKFQDRSLDSLSCGSFTKSLNFENHICD